MAVMYCLKICYKKTLKERYNDLVFETNMRTMPWWISWFWA